MKRFTILLFSFLFPAFFIQEAFSRQNPSASIEISISFAPDVVFINAKPVIYYELGLTNPTSDSVYLNRLEVMDVADSSVLLSFDREELNKRYALTGLSEKNGAAILLPGASAVIYVECTLPDQKNSRTLIHRLRYETGQHVQEKSSRSIKGGVIQISKKAPLTLGPPLSAGPWAAVYDPSWERGHRRVIFTVNDSARIPGRFAIDFIRMNNKGQYAKGDENEIKNWYGYAADVLAVADGVVTSVRDDFSESATLSAHPDYPSDKATGNYISIDLGNNHFAFYEHLKPGSSKVKPGQKVKKGAVIASLGFTGQSTGPHLHFHVATTNSPLGAEGIPFVVERFTLLGAYADLSGFGKVVWKRAESSKQQIIVNERPGPNSVITF